jgi:chemotaxis protein methyltransferase CheR
MKMETAPLPDADLEYVCRLVNERCAVVLDSTKRYLVESRLLPVAKANGFSSVSAMVARLRWRQDSDLHRMVVEALVTTETSFFRDVHPFLTLRDRILPDLMVRRRDLKSLTIWSAACASGQEPYSAAMVVRECVPLSQGWNVQILASDISTTMIERSRRGIYRQLEVNRGLPAQMLVRHFRRVDSRWEIDERLRAMISFFQHNLVGDWGNLPRVDVVLLRNVLIYFDIETRRKVLAKVKKLLKPDGYLFLGTAETTLNLDPAFTAVRSSRTVVYQLKKP